MQERRAPEALIVGRRHIRPQLAGRQGTVTRQAPAAFLWPFGPRRRRRALTPAADRAGARRNVSGGARGRKRGHPSGARILKPCVLAVKGARCARVAARSLQDPGPLRRRDSGGAYRRDGRTERWPTGLAFYRFLLGWS